MIYLSHNVEETISLGEKFAQKLVGQETVLLNGDLGAGKTHFTKGIALGLNINDVVTSPTFVLHNIYQGRLTLNHFDFYRINLDEAMNLGLDEYFNQKNAVSVIEWSSNIVELLPKNCIVVNIERVDDNIRRIEINVD